MNDHDLFESSANELKENIKQLCDDLNKLDGKPPYNEPSNICWGDAYFAKSLEKKYNKPLDELYKIAQRIGRK
jgi:hypothetical protein